jgi:sigma-B regulation protein RsbU (phosphoserine phosphatase)
MMNEAMYRESPAGGFITLFYGVIDVRTQEMVFANGGHEPPLLRKADGRVIRLLSDGIVLGVSPGIAYQEGTATIEKGDRLLLYTDGITEARKEAGDMLGEDRLREYWSKCCDIDAATALDRVYHWAREFSEGHFHDDVAMVVIAREE